MKQGTRKNNGRAAGIKKKITVRFTLSVPKKNVFTPTKVEPIPMRVRGAVDPELPG
jgi:hypothetical protein